MKCLGSLETYLLCFGPEYIFQVSGKAFTEPLLRPVPGPDGEAKPGVSNLVAEPRPAEVAPSSQRALREEDDVWAGEKGEKTVLSEPVRGCPGGFPPQPAVILCTQDPDPGRSSMPSETHKVAVYVSGSGPGCRFCQTVVSVIKCYYL